LALPLVHVLAPLSEALARSPQSPRQVAANVTVHDVSVAFALAMRISTPVWRELVLE